MECNTDPDRTMTGASLHSLTFKRTFTLEPRPVKSTTTLLLSPISLKTLQINLLQLI